MPDASRPLAARAFMVRMSTPGAPALSGTDEVAVGWSHATGLLDAKDDKAIRERLLEQNPGYYANARRLTSAASMLHLFLNVAQESDLVVVPGNGVFHVGTFVGEAYFSKEGAERKSDTAHRRRVKWLARDVKRTRASSRLVSRLKAYQTVINLTELLSHIHEALARPDGDPDLVFRDETRTAVHEAVRKNLHDGRMDDRAFERLVERLLVAMGGTDVKVVARRKDVGADVTATMEAGLVAVKVCVQVKYHRKNSSTGVHAVQQLEQAFAQSNGAFDVGLVLTSGVISGEALNAMQESAYNIQGLDGDDLIDLIIKHELLGSMPATATTGL